MGGNPKYVDLDNGTIPKRSPLEPQPSSWRTGILGPRHSARDSRWVSYNGSFRTYPAWERADDHRWGV